MASDNIALFNFYRRYKWGNMAFRDWQQGMVDYARGMFEGTFGGAVLQGGAVAPSGMNVTVNPFIALGPTGNLLVVNTVSTIPITAPSATNRRDYIVARPLLENSAYITNPDDPNASAPLKVLQKAQVLQVAGTIGATPGYPTLGPNDVILCGVSTRVSQASLTAVDLDLEVRDIVGKKSSIQQNAGKYDDRLRPYKSTNQVIGIKPSQLDSPQSRAFSYVNRQTPSIFPKDGGGLYSHTDTLVNFQTGTITGGDAVSADFTPTIPSSNNAIVASINILANDTLSIVYGTAGTRQQCYDGIKNQLASGAGAVALALNSKPLAFVIVYSSNGTAVTDIDFIDARNQAAIGNTIAGLGAGSTVAPGSYPVTLLPADTGKVILVNTSSARTITLPTPAAGLIYTVKDATGTASAYNITIARSSGGVKIDNVAANYACRLNKGSWTFESDGTDWFVVATADDTEVGSFTGTATSGFTSTVNTTVNYIKKGNFVTLYFVTFFGTSNSASNSISVAGLPSNIQPISPNESIQRVFVLDNNVAVSGYISIVSSFITLYKDGLANYASSGPKGLSGNYSISYYLN